MTQSTVARLQEQLLLMNSIRRKCPLPSPSSNDLTYILEQVANLTGFLAKWNSEAGSLLETADGLLRNANS